MTFLSIPPDTHSFEVSASDFPFLAFEHSLVLLNPSLPSLHCLPQVRNCGCEAGPMLGPHFLRLRPLANINGLTAGPRFIFAKATSGAT